VLAFVELNSEVDYLNIHSGYFKPLEEKFPDIKFEYLRSYDELKERIAEPEFIFCWEFSEDLYVQAKNLKAIFTPAAGKDWIQDDPLEKIPVFHGTFHGPMIAETMLRMMLYFNYNFKRVKKEQEEMRWNRDAQGRTLLAGSHVLIVGYGHIGKVCAERLISMGCSVSGLQRKYKKGEDLKTGVKYFTWETVDNEFRKADHVVCVLPGGDETKYIFKKKYFSLMKRTAYLYNFGRGTIYKEEDLVWALKNGIIAGAGLDVFEKEPLPEDSELWQLDNVLLTAHACCGYMDYGRLFVEELEKNIIYLFEKYEK